MAEKSRLRPMRRCCSEPGSARWSPMPLPPRNPWSVLPLPGTHQGLRRVPPFESSYSPRFGPPPCIVISMERKRKYAPRLSVRRFSPEQDAEIAAWYQGGQTQRSIAERLGVNRTLVRNSLLRSEVTMRPKNSPRPSYLVATCACGRRAAYKTGQCVSCYNKVRNSSLDTQERKFNWRLMTQGLTRAAYDMLLEAQGGVCAICLQPDPRTGHRLAVDHDHTCCPGEN